MQERRLSFATAQTLRARIALLPDAGAQWKATHITPKHGKPKALVTLFHRDPVEIIADLLGRPWLSSVMEYAPKRAWENEDRESRKYNEMSTGNWWWRIQVSEVMATE